MLQNDDYGITAAERLEGACVTVGTCPFCGTEHVFRSIGPPDEELLVMWAMERCGCLEAKMERMARAEARREARRKRDDTY